jgi:small multidrug resistance family-3 protein
MFELKTIGLFLITAAAEIVGCYLPYLWLRENKSVWLLLPAALSLALFAWLLSLHPAAAGRVYAAYGGVYIFVAIVWLWAVDGIRPTHLGYYWFIGGTCGHGNHHVCSKKCITSCSKAFALLTGTVQTGAAWHYRAVLVRCALRAPLCRLARRYAFTTS